MTDSFTILGLATNADEHAIKAAYAKLLRQTRPDEDPHGFQRLNEAYQRALATCRSRSGGIKSHRVAWRNPPNVTVVFKSSPDASLRTAHGTPPASRAPNDPGFVSNAPAAQSRFDFAPFLANFRQFAEAADATALRKWLSAEPGLWHVSTKQAAGRHLLKALFDDPVPTTEECLDATLDFFLLNDALSGIDPILLNRLKKRATGEWIVRSDLHSFAWQLYGSASSRNLLELRRFFRQCTRPFHWPGALLRSFRSGNYTKFAAGILLKLCGGYIDDLPKSFDRTHARFWMEAAARGLNRTRLIIFAFRSAIALAVIPSLGLLVNLISSGGEPDPAGIRATLMVTVSLTSAVIGAAWLWIGAGWSIREFDKLVHRSRMAAAISIGFTPALCVLSLIAARWMDPALGTILAIIVLVIAIWRFLSRHAVRARAGPLQRIGFFVFISVCFNGLSKAFDGRTGMGLMPPLIIACVALVVWGFDMKKSRWRSLAG